METLKLAGIAILTLVVWFVVCMTYVVVQYRIVTGRWPTE